MVVKVQYNVAYSRWYRYRPRLPLRPFENIETSAVITSTLGGLMEHTLGQVFGSGIPSCQELDFPMITSPSTLIARGCHTKTHFDVLHPDRYQICSDHLYHLWRYRSATIVPPTLEYGQYHRYMGMCHFWGCLVSCFNLSFNLGPPRSERLYSSR